MINVEKSIPKYKILLKSNVWLSHKTVYEMKYLNVFSPEVPSSTFSCRFLKQIHYSTMYILTNSSSKSFASVFSMDWDRKYTYVTQ